MEGSEWLRACLCSGLSLPVSVFPGAISAHPTETSPGMALSQGGPTQAAQGHKGGLGVTRMPDEDAYNASCPLWAGLEHLQVLPPQLQGGVTRMLQGATKRKWEQGPGVMATEKRNSGAGLHASLAGTQPSRKRSALQVLPNRSLTLTPRHVFDPSPPVEEHGAVVVDVQEGDLLRPLS